jgi:hypothetical protein
MTLFCEFIVNRMITSSKKGKIIYKSLLFCSVLCNIAAQMYGIVHLRSTTKCLAVKR